MIKTKDSDYRFIKMGLSQYMQYYNNTTRQFHYYNKSK